MKIYRLNDEEYLISDRLNKKVGTKTDWLREEDLKSADRLTKAVALYLNARKNVLTIHYIADRVTEERLQN